MSCGNWQEGCILGPAQTFHSAEFVHEEEFRDMLQVNLPDGSSKEFTSPVTPFDVAAAIGPRLAQAALAAVVDGRIVGLDTRLPESGAVSLRLLTPRIPNRWGSCVIRPPTSWLGP